MALAVRSRFPRVSRFLAVPLLLVVAACQTVPVAPQGPYSPEQVAVLKQYAFQEVGDDWALGMDGKLLFPTDDSDLGEDQAQNIGQMARSLLTVGIHGARVEGHTDSTGTARYNQELSTRRAEAVKQALISGGMADGRVEVIGKGATQPIESNRTAAGRSENRRVVVIITPANALPY